MVFESPLIDSRDASDIQPFLEDTSVQCDFTNVVNSSLVEAMATKLQFTVSINAVPDWLSTSGAPVQLFRAWYIESGHTQTTERVKL